MYEKRGPLQTKRTLNILQLRSSESDKQKLGTAKGVKEHDNCFWDIIDPHCDIPVGLLHLIPLGLAEHIVKHIVNNINSVNVESSGCCNAREQIFGFLQVH